MKWNKSENNDSDSEKVQDFELRKEKRKQRFKNKKKDRKRFDTQDEPLDDKEGDDEDYEYWDKH